MTRVFVVLTAVSSIFLSALFVSVVAMNANWKEAAQVYMSEAAAAIVERESIAGVMNASLALKEDELRSVIQQRDEMTRRMQQLTDELASVRGELAQARNKEAAAEAGRKKLEEIIGVQTSQLASTQRQNQQLLTENIDLQTSNQQFASRNLELTSELTIRNDEIRNLQEKLIGREQLAAPGAPRGRIALDPDTPRGVVASAAPVSAGEIRAEIVDVAGNYASISAGEDSGITQGMTAMVYRGGQYLADLVVDTVRPREAGGKLQTLVGEVRAGDRVHFIR